MSVKVREMEQRVVRGEQQVMLLQRLSRALARDAPLGDLLQQAVSLVAEFMECDSCLLYLRDHERLVLCASNTPHPDSIGTVALQVSEGLTGWVARERRLLAISREAYNDPRFKFFRDLPEDTFEAFLSAPILARNQVMGVLNVQHQAPHAHAGSEMEMLTTVGELVGCRLLMPPTGAGVPSLPWSELALASVVGHRP